MNEQSRLRSIEIKSGISNFDAVVEQLDYSPSVKALPREAKDYVFGRLADVLAGKDQTKPFSHLTSGDHQAIREILVDTLPELSDRWPQTRFGAGVGR